MTSHTKPFLSPVSSHFIFVLHFLNFTDAVIHLPAYPASQTHKFPKRCIINLVRMRPFGCKKLSFLYYDHGLMSFPLYLQKTLQYLAK